MEKFYIFRDDLLKDTFIICAVIILFVGYIIISLFGGAGIMADPKGLNVSTMFNSTVFAQLISLLIFIAALISLPRIVRLWGIYRKKIPYLILNSDELTIQLKEIKSISYKKISKIELITRISARGLKSNLAEIILTDGESQTINLDLINVTKEKFSESFNKYSEIKAIIL